MTFELNPAKTFRAVHSEIAVEHAAAVRTNKFHVIHDFALSEMSTGRDITPEELRGAKIYINILLNMAEKPESPKPAAPDKSLGQPPNDKK